MKTESTTYNLLNSISYPEDLRKLSVEQLPEICKELRQDIIQEVSCNPGHFAASLGTVELTVALHYVLQHSIRPHCMGRGASGLRAQDAHRTSRGFLHQPEIQRHTSFSHLPYESDYDTFALADMPPTPFRRLWAWPWRQPEKARKTAMWLP